MATEQVRRYGANELPLQELRSLAPDILWRDFPTLSPDLSPIEICQTVGEWYVAHSSDARRREAGQFFTPPIVARYMANVAGRLAGHARILDPGAGVSILSCAMCESALVQHLSALTIVAYESDPVLYALCSFTLNHARDILHEHGIEISIELHQQDFLEAIAEQKDPVLHLPVSDIDTHLLQAFRHWNTSLATLGLEISTGPVVAFRASDVLTTSIEDVKQGRAVPILWLQHVHRMHVEWPLEHFDKPQAVLRQEGQKLLVKNSTQIILRRFSAKEEPRRITAAVLPEGAFGTEMIALENHLNYVCRPGGTLSRQEALGIAAFLNSTLVDRYFRITNGNTQVNATELRKLPLPPWERLTRIGERVASLEDAQDFDAMERIIMEELEEELSAFLNFAEFKRHTPQIAWETEDWIAEMPEHMIHYNGEKFLGPHK